MGRYQAFGNLFATADGQTYRLDRHPVMSRHPVTSMDEADLGKSSAQTELSVGLVSLADMHAGNAEQALFCQIKGGAKIVALDVVDDSTLAEAGRLVWCEGETPVFAIGSQGIEYALVAHWI